MKDRLRYIAAVFLTIALQAGAQNQPARPATQPTADETAVRRTLAGIEQRINNDDIGFVNVFATDAVIIAPSAPDIVGFDAIRTLYEEVLKHAKMEVHFSTEEIAIAGDLAYERGTYTLRISDRASGRTLQDLTNKHIHIFKRQPDGSWKTWRMMTSSAAPSTSK